MLTYTSLYFTTMFAHTFLNFFTKLPYTFLYFFNNAYLLPKHLFKLSYTFNNAS